MLNITLDESLVEKRIDAALAQKLEVPRARVARLIKDGSIWCNNKKVKASYKIETGDIVSYPEKLTSPPIIEKETPPELNIVFEDDGLIVIEKPAGLLVHQTGPEDPSATVADALVEKYPAAITVGDGTGRPGIVHRLDKDVSGLMVVAKTQEAYEALKAQFKDRTVEKEYLALVYGQLPHDHAEIKLKIARSKGKGRMVARPEDQDGKDAHTEYDVIERFKTATYAKVKILTGRTHQIRVHFQGLGHPVVGDKLYGRNIPKGIRAIKLDRILLHSHRLVINVTSGERREFISPLPSELKALIDNLPKT